MTIEEMRKTEEYTKIVQKVKKYRKGFEFTLDVNVIPRPQWNALRMVMRDLEKQGLIENIEFDYSIDGGLLKKNMLDYSY